MLYKKGEAAFTIASRIHFHSRFFCQGNKRFCDPILGSRDQSNLRLLLPCEGAQFYIGIVAVWWTGVKLNLGNSFSEAAR